MVQASVTGAIDFSKGDITDPRWWQQAHWRLDAVERDNSLKFHSQWLNYNLTAWSRSEPGSEASNERNDRCAKSLREIINSVWPGEAQAEEPMESQADRLRKGYAQEFGDPSDPEYQAKVAQAVAAMEARHEINKDQAKKLSDKKHGRHRLRRK